MVVRVAVDVMELERQRFTAPLREAASLTREHLEAIRDQAPFQVVAVPLDPVREDLLVRWAARPRFDVAALDGVGPSSSGEPELGLALAHGVAGFVVRADLRPVVPPAELAVAGDPEGALV